MNPFTLLFLFISSLSLAQLKCDDKLWEHVYKQRRLQVVEKCKTVTGVIYHIKREKDGDLHIQLKLDPGQETLLNDRNLTVQKQCLVIEPVCVNEVTQKSAVEACRDYMNQVQIPFKGQHVRVTGTYVLDKEGNHGWMEIHPVTKIEVIR
jgi:hypothetical protein